MFLPFPLLTACVIPFSVLWRNMEAVSCEVTWQGYYSGQPTVCSLLIQLQDLRTQEIKWLSCLCSSLKYSMIRLVLTTLATAWNRLFLQLFGSTELALWVPGSKLAESSLTLLQIPPVIRSCSDPLQSSSYLQTFSPEDHVVTYA